MEKLLSVTGMNHDCRGAPVSVCLNAPRKFNSIRLVVDDAEEQSVPCQWEPTDNGIILTWIENGLKKNTTRTYRVAFSEDQDEYKKSCIELEENGKGRIDVFIDQQFFTTYNFGPECQRPYFHPVVGPFRATITRAFPIIQGVAGETTDHPHHKGIYVAHGDVNMVDNWTDEQSSGYTLHRGFDVISSGIVYGHIVAQSDWVTSDKQEVLLTETREIKFYNVGTSRLMDVNVNLTALSEDVLFGDTKEGGILSVRVASSMDVARGGTLENSFGGINENEVWGKRAHWCDYSGLVNNNVVGIALFDHNKNFRHPTYWHSRNYGLMTANPFGLSVFEGSEFNGDYNLCAGDSLRFRYRIYIHKGDATAGKVAEKYHNYVNPPTVTVI